MEGPSRADIRYEDCHDGSVTVLYTPRVPGEYKVTVRYDGISIRGSPFTVRIRGDEDSGLRATSTLSSKTLGSSGSRGGVANVRVSGRGLYSGITNVQNEISVDVKEAGSGRLHYSISGPGNVESKNHGLMDGRYR